LPILIDGNSNFNTLNGVVSGSGTATNPWIIEGWSIAATPIRAGVEIAHTTDYFVIRNIETSFIYFLSSSHGAVLNSTLNGGQLGFGSSMGEVLRIEKSPDTTISRNKLVNGTIYVSDSYQGPLSANLVIANNTLVNSKIYIGSCARACLQNPPMMKILGNSLVDKEPPCTDPHNLCDRPCAICESAIGTTIANNTVSGYWKGIEVGGSDSTVKDNLLQTTGDDIVLNTVNSTTVSGNIMTGLGITITGLYSSSPYGLDRAESYYDSHSIAANNLVNGKPVLYYARCAGVSLANVEINQLIIASCSNVDLVNVRAVGKVGAGVFMAYVKHAKLSQDHLDGNAIALGVLKSSDVNVSDSEISNNADAIYVSFSTGFTLERSTVSMNGAALFVGSSTNTTISDNLFASNNIWGIRLSDATNAVVSRNRLQNSYGLGLANVANAVIQGNQISDSWSDGLTLDSVVNSLVEGNWISNSSRYGIAVSAANGLNITANTAVYNAVGILLGSSLNGAAIYNTIVYHNNFVYSIRDQGEYYSGVVLKLDNGYPSGGNYWSDYTGVDRCSGVNQDVCPQPDGIGDTSYSSILLLPCYICYQNLGPPVDQYPLMKPLGTVTQDTRPPQWPIGSTLVLTKVNSTSVSLQWSKASDDTWVSRYLITENGKVIAGVQGNVLSYTLSGLTPGSTYVFKIDASDPGSMTSSDGPSSTITLPVHDQNPNPFQGRNPFNLAWWAQNPMTGYLVGLLVAVVAGSMLLIRRRLLTAKPVNPL
jgi:parallel beta-helix repeat protein